jgi:hypothetical protein
MRMMPSRLVVPKPATVKRLNAQIRHVSAPVKGLALQSKLSTGDPLTATILRNFVIEDDRIISRAGYVLETTCAGAQMVHCLIPYYGDVPSMLAATNHTLCRISDGAAIKSGFLSDDWDWTSFANLGDAKYTVLCNGVDGVWSWSGGSLGASIVKETITAPASATWIIPDQFQIVLSHMNRLWFADNTNLAVYYLPLQQKAGEVKYLPLNSLFKRGGSIRAMYTWTLEGGVGTNDQLVIFTTNGEAAVYSGVDPDSDFNLVGIYRFDTPMSKHSVINYGGDLYVLVATGVVPLSTMMRAEQDNLGQVDRNVISIFLAESTKSYTRPGWQLFFNPSSARLIANMPTGAAGEFRQMIRHMPRPVWSEWSHVPATCWGWIEPYLYFGMMNGQVHRMHPSLLNDAGQPIPVDVQGAWSLYGTPAIKQFKMIQPYLTTDGDLRPLIDIKVDYDFSPPINQPDISFGLPGAEWDLATWDEDYWAGDDARAVKLWNGVSAIGRVGAPRLQANLMNCQLAVNGWDVLFEAGAAVG